MSKAKLIDKEFIRLAVTLFLITAIVALLLGAVNALTKDKIAALKTETQHEAMQSVMPSAHEFTDITEDALAIEGMGESVKTVYETEHGFVFGVTVKGFGGDIEMVVGVDDSGYTTGAVITSMSETAGMGANASEESFIGQFTWKSGELEVIKSGNPSDNQVFAIAGATITSNAVTKGINDALRSAQLLTR
ncbi:MAG: FMN-binding protein [Clostridiales bacterium]|nr:FMN-binding protein [Clostridiales bacterium]